MRKAILIATFQIGVNVIGLPDIIGHYLVYKYKPNTAYNKNKFTK